MLPPLYAGWITQLLPGPIPEESRATCHDCAMLPQPGQDTAGRVTFHPSTKCCTYVPVLPNFLTGRILRDEDAGLERGKATVRERLEGRDGVSPLGLDRPARFGLLYRHSRGFGRTPSMRCPHYLEAEGGLCGVWKHRNAICSTWWCKHERGAVGEAFWQALERLLRRVEQNLMWWAALQSGLGTEAIQALVELHTPATGATRLSAEALEGTAEPATYTRIWGDWEGREEAFYAECAAHVEGLSEWNEVLAACDPLTTALAQVTQAAYARLAAPELPERVRMGPFRVIQNDNTHVLVDSYREYDPLSLSRPLLDLLPAFDGRPIGEVLAELRSRRGVVPSAELLQRLVDFQVLIHAAD